MSNVLRRFGLVFFILITCALNARASQELVISPDRPGFSVPPSLVPKNHFQLEIGFSYDRSDLNGTLTKAYSWNQSLFRFGLLSFAEIRLATYFAKTKTETSDGTSAVNGFGPFTLGTKIALFQERGVIPKTSLMANFVIPKTGLPDYRVRSIAPSVLLLFQNSLSDKLSLGYNIGLIWDGESSQPATLYAVSLGLTLSGKLTCYAENFGSFKPAGNAFYVDAGLAYLLTPRMQLDVSGGISTRGGKRHVQISGGFSWLIF
jgi:Putative MetA-pathway of phenol degradation